MSAPPDHIGWDLVCAARVWESAFVEDVTAAGHPWFADARGRLVQHIGRKGVGQAALADRAGMTKQAVAQHLDRLESDGLIARVADSEDSRKRRVVWTDAGQRALDDIDAAKLRVERRLKARLGAQAFAALRRALKEVVK